MGAPAQSGDPSWGAYPETVLEIRDGSRLLRVDLREDLSDDLRSDLRCLRRLGEFGVVTAANPLGRQLSDSENARRHVELEAELNASGSTFLPADGVSPDGRHREPGFAVWLAQGGARGFAQRFEQTAFFYFDGTVFWLVTTDDSREPIRLPASKGGGASSTTSSEWGDQ
jgi:hypothetical protein